jgi:hypothetical protein
MPSRYPQDKKQREDILGFLKIVRNREAERRELGSSGAMELGISGMAEIWQWFSGRSPISIIRSILIPQLCNSVTLFSGF